MRLSTITRRGALMGAMGLAAASPALAEPPHDITFEQDFDELWRTLAERYCFFADKQTDWDKVRTLYRPLAAEAQTQDAFGEVIRRVLAELYDMHTHLSGQPDGAPRWPLYDLMGERSGNAVRVTAIKASSAAETAGIRIGDHVLSVDGKPIAERIAELAPKCLKQPDPAAEAYAVNAALAGRTATPRRLTVKTGSAPPRELDLPLAHAAERPEVAFRRLDGGLGYIAIHSFAETESVEQFDTALAELKDTRGLVIDVRGNGGGDTAVARPIMGRFITTVLPYARMRRREGPRLSEAWTESVEPRGPFTYAAPVVVLTDHWSGSMAEGFPMGMRDIGRARIVGTRMMGLGAAVLALRLDRTGLQAQFSGEPVYDTRDHPRWLLEPDVETRPGADILVAGVAELRRLTATA